MATAVYKEVWTFSGSNGRWTEVWYVARTAGPQTNPVPMSVISARLVLSPPAYQLEKIRISDVVNPRITGQQDVNMPGSRPVTTLNLPSDSAAVYGVGSTVNGARRQWRLRGLSSADLSLSPTFPKGFESPSLQRNVKAFIFVLASNGYVIYNRETPKELAYKPPRATKADGSIIPGLTTITLSAPLTLIAGDRIRIRKANKKDLPGLNGAYDVTPATSATWVISYSTPENQSVNMTTGDAVIERFHSDSVIDPALTRFLFWGSRQTKNAATGSRGRPYARRARSQA